jgi:hypothetical protein
LAPWVIFENLFWLNYSPLSRRFDYLSRFLLHGNA